MIDQIPDFQVRCFLGRSTSASAATPQSDFLNLSMSTTGFSVPLYSLPLSRLGDLTVCWTASRTQLKHRASSSAAQSRYADQMDTLFMCAAGSRALLG